MMYAPGIVLHANTICRTLPSYDIDDHYDRLAICNRAACIPVFWIALTYVTQC